MSPGLPPRPPRPPRPGGAAGLAGLPGPLDRELSEAAFVCDLIRVRDLLVKGASPDARDGEGRPPLVSAILGNSLALVGLLLESKANVDAADPHGWTPLHFAAEEALPQMTSLLLAKGADANLKDDAGNTALHRAVFSARGRDEVVRLLRKAGARDDVKNKAGETPKSLAERLGETVFTTN
jgi:ankyrin repeat protein